MKATPENNVKKKIKEVLNASACFWYSAGVGMYSCSGLPDLMGISQGRGFGIEAKAPGKKPTALQVMMKNKIEAAGGKWFLVDGPESLKEVETWLATR